MNRNHVTIQQPRIDGAGSFECIIEDSIYLYKTILLHYRTKATEKEKFVAIFGITFVTTQLILRSIKYSAGIIIYLLSEINLNIISLLWITLLIHLWNHNYMRRYLMRQTPLTPTELGSHPSVQDQVQQQVNVNDFQFHGIFNPPPVDEDVADDATVHDN